MHGGDSSAKGELHGGERQQNAFFRHNTPIFVVCFIKCSQKTTNRLKIINDLKTAHTFTRHGSHVQPLRARYDLSYKSPVCEREECSYFAWPLQINLIVCF